MGNQKSKWTKLSINSDVALRLENSATLMLQLHTLWDSLPPNCKYAVMFDDYHLRPGVKPLVDKLYAIQLAFAVKANGESNFRVSTCIQLEFDEFTFIMIACNPRQYRELFGNLEVIVEYRIAAESLESILWSN